MQKLKSQRGFSLVELLICFGILASILMVSISSIVQMNALLSNLGNSESSIESSNVIIGPILAAPRYEIENLCTTVSSWSFRASRCDALDFETPPAKSTSISKTAGLPIFATALGIDLRKLKINFAQNLLCLDLVECRYVFSDAILELRFDYSFRSAKGGDTIKRTIKVRSGSRG